jgi:hypothetical protein
VFENRSSTFLYVLPAAFVALTLAGCGGSKEPAEQAATPLTDDVTIVAAQAEADAAAAAQAAKEAELARLEADMTVKEREADLARREADPAAKQRAAQKAAAPRPTATAPVKAPAPVAKAPEAVAKTYVVPAGTQMSVEIVSPITTKTARVGDRIDGRLASDVVVDGKTLVMAGAPVHGTVTEVVSGSQKIGGTPTLGLTFNQLTLTGADTVAISGRITELGKSDTGRDTAKIAGGALAGAVIGHQIDSDKGKIIGGILGGAAGALAAKKTGTEVEVPSGTVVGFLLDDSFEVIAK